MKKKRRKRRDWIMIRVKRIYDQPSKEDGFRILADRLWPRGLSEDKAKVNLWLREIAPATASENGFPLTRKSEKSLAKIQGRTERTKRVAR